VGFFVVHITQVVRAGWNNFRAMVTGVEVVQAPATAAVTLDGAPAAAVTTEPMAP
jgi:hypothetical protein